MVMTMGFLGREKRRSIIYLGFFHIMGALLGGAIIGGLLGLIGQSLSLWRWRSEIILIVAIFALWQAMTKRPAKLGMQRQVPRTWVRTMFPELCYFLWGAILGSGVATVIPYSAFLVLLSAQLTSSFVWGCLSGTLFGAARQLISLIPLIQTHYRLHPEDAAMLIPGLTRRISALNILWIIGGSILLLITSMFWIIRH